MSELNKETKKDTLKKFLPVVLIGLLLLVVLYSYNIKNQVDNIDYCVLNNVSEEVVEPVLNVTVEDLNKTVVVTNVTEVVNATNLTTNLVVISS